MMKILFQIVLGIILFSPHRVAGQQDSSLCADTIGVYDGLFEEEEPMNLTLQFNMKSFQRTRQREQYQPAELTCQVNDTFKVIHPVRVKARGTYRRDHCVNPPFWMNIRYSAIEAEELCDVKRMKVVVRCRANAAFDSYVLREYLVYRIYNMVSPYSFRTRLIRLKYIDTGRKNRETENWAFLIEPNDLMAERLNATLISNDRLSMRRMNPRAMDLLAMFHYMIGNGDYSVTGRHNLKILVPEPGGPGGFIPVPYDFDYTGLVNTEYAVPGESLGISSVRERYFLGPCRSKRMHLDAANKLLAAKEEIMELINGFEYLDEKERADMVGYIEAFFIEAADERFVEEHIATTCR
ncbi:MAG: hypothetical protein ABFS10_02710 [Bacteroidota bacterium]